MLYLNDDTSEMIFNTKDFQQLLYDKLGSDAEEYFIGCIENYEYEMECLRKELDYLKMELNAIENN